MTTPRSNPLARVEEALRQGLESQAKECTITVEQHQAGGKAHELFFIRAYGAEWHVSAEMSEPTAYSTGQSVARMIREARERAEGKTG